MNEITHDEVIQYIAGEIRDPATRERIQRARRENPRVEEWFERLEQAMEAEYAQTAPEPSVRSATQGPFHRVPGTVSTHPVTS